MQPHAATYALLDELERAGEAVGQKVTCLVTGGGSDGNFISHYGVATLDGCGPCGGKNQRKQHHQPGRNRHPAFAQSDAEFDPCGREDAPHCPVLRLKWE